LGRMRPEVQPVDVNGAAIGLPQSDDTFESGGFTGAVRSQQSKNLACTDLEADVANRLGSAVSLP
jgi:hypothetical protein